MAIVRFCPVCETRNAPSVNRCETCGAMLIGADLVEGDPSVTRPGVEATPPVAHPPPGAPRLCPNADCGQPNPPDAHRCLYCNGPLGEATAPAPGRMRAFIRWPWGEEQEITDCLVIGREEPTPPQLAQRLEREFQNVSRRHAELRIDADGLWIVDLDSRNGTFIDDVRIAPRQRVRLANGARLRFAATVIAEVLLRDA